MKIGILGAGALGCAIGAALSEGGAQVTLLNRRPDHVDAINTHGLQVRDQNGERIVSIQAACTAEDVGPVDLIIVLVKSFHTEQAIAQAGPMLAPHTAVLSLQNGLGNEELIAQAVGRDRVLAGRTYVGGVMLGPGRIISGIEGKATVIGELDGAMTERVERIAEVFRQAGMIISVSDNILGTIWDKLLINVATGALSAITRLPYGPMYERDDLQRVGVSAVREAMDVAQASGIRLSIKEPIEAWVTASKGLPYDFKASMLQSIEKGSVTEVDFIHGSVVRQAEKLGIPTPVNATLIACVKAIESTLKPVEKARLAHVDHVAVRVADIAWHMRFFQEVFGMSITEVDGPTEAPRQVWFDAGIQLIATQGHEARPSNDAGWLAHIALQVADREAVLEHAASWGIDVLPQAANWIQTPDGLALELFQNTSVLFG